MRTRGWRAGLVTAAAVALLPLCAGLAQASQTATTWMLSTTALQHVKGAVSELKSDTVYQISDTVSDHTKLLSNAKISYHEYSGETAASDVATAALPTGTEAIVLDQENWGMNTCPGGRACTSTKDLADPVMYATQAAQAVQKYNGTHKSAPLTLIVTPGLDLFSKGALGCGKGNTRSDFAQCYLSYDLAGKMAAIPGVAVIELQAQELEGDPGAAGENCALSGTTISYWCFVSQAAAQAQTAAKNAGKTIVILAGLATRPTTEIAPCTIQHSADKVQSLVSGFWMNVPNPSKPTYAEAADVMLGTACTS